MHVSQTSCSTHTIFHSYIASQTWLNITTPTVRRWWQLVEELSTSLYQRLTEVVASVCITAITETTAAITTDICSLLPCSVTLPAIYRTPPSTWPFVQGAVVSPRILKPTVTEVSSSPFWPHGAILVLLDDIWCYWPVTAVYSRMTVPQVWRM